MISFGNGLGSLQGIVLLILCLAAFGLQVYALIDAVRQRSDAFPAAGKQTKTIWLAILAVASAIGFISLGVPMALLFLNLIAVVAACVYLVDVRPAVRGMTGRGGRPGPYGSW